MAEKQATHGSSNRLTLYICIAIVLAIVLAVGWPHKAVQLKVGGEIFLSVLKMLVVPLVMASVMSGILGLGDVRKLGRPGLLTIVYYLSTTLMAVFVGLVLVSVLRPGDVQIDADTLATSMKAGAEKAEMAADKGVSSIFENLIRMFFTDNLFRAALEMDLLPLIVFSIVFAGLLTVMGERASALAEIITQVFDALIAFVLVVMRLAPLGIFCLVAARFGEANAQDQLGNVLKQTGWYSLTVVLGLAIHGLGTLPLIYWIVRRENPYRFLANMAQPLLTAFSTASSSATLPVTMEAAVVRGGVSKRASEFVLPLGATVNMDGTALYEAVAAIFIAQVVGVDMSLFELVVVALTATLAAIGAAGIPEAGLFTMIIVLKTVDLPVAYVGLLLPVDWLLDRFRTAVNVFGDTVGAAVVDDSFSR
ncbi:MAG: dicarboxylate/amino acid:cation symporter, partial [Planctomycetales bacterium]|nr:dicarboxylate/amino acid:cation symporter [Planctomycetales bacterium]